MIRESNTYYIKIYCDGITHEQLVQDKDDIKILTTVLNKIKRDANKLVNPKIKTNQNY